MAVVEFVSLAVKETPRRVPLLLPGLLAEPGHQGRLVEQGQEGTILEVLQGHPGQVLVEVELAGTQAMLELAEAVPEHTAWLPSPLQLEPTRTRLEPVERWGLLALLESLVVLEGVDLS